MKPEPDGVFTGTARPPTGLETTCITVTSLRLAQLIQQGWKVQYEHLPGKQSDRGVALGDSPWKQPLSITELFTNGYKCIVSSEP